jgi:hypothetical protein
MTAIMVLLLLLVSRVEALRVVEGEEKGARCLGVQLRQRVTGGHKYRDLVLQVGG